MDFVRRDPQSQLYIFNEDNIIWIENQQLILQM
jgi:hypothetical protein